MEKEARWELLEKGSGVWVTKEYGFTTDTLLLARFSQPRRGEACADLGTGCGMIPMLWRSRGEPESVLAVEIEKDGAALAARSAEQNGFVNVKVMCGDAREYRTILPHQKLDLIACNPPYYPLGAGAAAEKERKTARCDETFTLSDLAAAAKWGLKWGGRLCLCLRTERLAEALALFRGERLEPKRLRLVQSGPDKQPYLFLLECRYGGKPGLEAEPVLILGNNEKFYQGGN